MDRIAGDEIVCDEPLLGDANLGEASSVGQPLRQRSNSPSLKPLLWIALGFALAVLGSVFPDSEAPNRTVSSGTAPGWTAPDQAPAIADAPLSPTGRRLAGMPETVQPGSESRNGWTGVVVPKSSVNIAAEASGRIDRMLVRVGDKVQAGQILARLDRRALEDLLRVEQASLDRAQADVKRRRLEVDRADREQERRRRLVDVLSKEQIEESSFQTQDARAGLEAAEAELRRIEAQVQRLLTQLRRTNIRAPFAGTVAERYSDPGSMTGPGSPMLRLNSAERLVRFAVPPEAAEALVPGSRLQIEVDSEGRRDPGSQAGEVANVFLHQSAAELDPAAQMLFFESSALGRSAEADPWLVGGVVSVTLLREPLLREPLLREP